MRAHGTRARYLHGPDENDRRGCCRCTPCTTAATKARERYRLELSLGARRPMADAVPVRAHVESLIRAGGERREIAQRSGVTWWVIRDLLDGKLPRRRIRHENAVALLAVTVEAIEMERLIRAVGTQRRLRSLAVLGYSTGFLAQRMRRNRDWLTVLTSASEPLTVSQDTATRVREAHADLWHRSPADFGITPRVAALVRGLALKKGYRSALAWDDIDDPNEKPAGVRRAVS